MTPTSFERILKALHGEFLERPPFTLTLSLYGARLTGCPLSEYYRDCEKYVEGQDAVVSLCDPDIVFAPFALTLEAEAFGSELTFLPTNPPNLRKPAFKDPEHFERLDLPDIDSHPSLLYLRESIRLLSRSHKGKKAVCALVTAPVDLPALVMGIDMWIETLICQEALAKAILEKISGFFIRLSNAFFSDGADFIALPTVFTHPSFLYRDLIDRLMLPVLHRALQELKGPIVFHHVGNPLVPYLQDYRELPNVAAYALDHRDSFKRARQVLGPRPLLLGNLNGPTLSALPVESVLEATKGILEDRKDDPGFVFCTSAADIPWNVSPSTIRAIADTVKSLERCA
ncbi:MAG: uroporphyrinogen decarboxylase family protein [Syntrophobacteraceae bacterium]